jgi:two-component system, NarL family, response regulator NreC
MTTILLADDHHVVRLGLRALLDAEPDFDVIGEATDGLETSRMVETLKPEVLIVDLMMPGINGLEVTRQVSRRTSQTRIIILSMHANEAYVLEALRNGASAYVLKDSRADDLVYAVREVMEGRRYLSPPLSERAINSYIQQANESTLDPYETLTNREREVLNLAAQGCNATEIAQKLSISGRTAETHRANLMRKLDLHTQTDLIRYALRRGIIALED